MKKLLSVLASVLFGAAAAPSTILAADQAAQEAQMEYVRLKTSMGDIVLELNGAKAPISTKNFLAYTDKGHYDGTVFHRVIGNFMIQGGGFTPDLSQKPTDPPIANESGNGLMNVRGSVAMARTADLNSATSQFYINVVDNSFLDTNKYAVFGQVISGMDTVDKIKAVETSTQNGMGDVPTKPVLIESAKRVDLATVKDLVDQARKAEAEAKSSALKAGIDYIKNQKNLDVSAGVTSPTGLWTLDTIPGQGAQPSPTSKVKVHYTGWLTNGQKFDSSKDRGEPIVFGLNQVIKGWTEGVGGMKAGGTRYLVIPPELGYGARGAPGAIPPNSTLIFEVELLEVVGQ